MNAYKMLLQKFGSGEARALYEFVMRHRFGLSRTDVLFGKDTTLSADDKAELQIIIDRIAKGEPVQYVLGCEEFCGREFLVGPGVLIPRPETQQLVQLVEQYIAPGGSVLDVGTGSGCIAITLALAGYHLTAFDISEEALGYARRNAERLGAEVDFLREDITICPILLASRSSQFNAIVSNPPYICQKEAAEMDDNVLRHEPHLALFVPDDDPLLFYRVIADYACQHLADEGWLFFEANRAYTTQVGALLQEKGYKDIKIIKDQFDNERFVIGRLGD